MSDGILATLIDYVEQGGHAMPPLIACLLVLWYALGYRATVLWRGHRASASRVVDAYRRGPGPRPLGILDAAARRAVAAERRAPASLRGALDEALFPYYQDVKAGRTIIRGIVSIAPVIGLLGTVSGMIETFDSLGDMTLFAQSGGIAGGISQALFTTQMGLCVAIPGVVLGRLLDRRQRAIEDELDQLKALVAGAPTTRVSSAP